MIKSLLLHKQKGPWGTNNKANVDRWVMTHTEHEEREEVESSSVNGAKHPHIILQGKLKKGRYLLIQTASTLTVRAA